MSGTIFLLALALTTDAEAANGWKRVESNEGGYQICMPEEILDREMPSHESGIGDQHLKVGFLDDKTGGCTVSYFDYATESACAVEASARLAEICKKGVGDRKLMKSKEIRVEGHSGLEIEFRGEMKGQPTYFHAKLVLVDRRMYQLIVVCNRKEIPAEVSDRFFGSFKLLQRPSNSATETRVEERQ